MRVNRYHARESIFADVKCNMYRICDLGNLVGDLHVHADTFGDCNTGVPM